MRLERCGTASRRVMLAPMVDVLLILLIFFMVTSTYRTLEEHQLAGGDGALRSQATASPPPTLVVLAASGALRWRGGPADLAALAATGRPVYVLPSFAATAAHLAQALDQMAALGIEDVLIVQAGAGP